VKKTIHTAAADRVRERSMASRDYLIPVVLLVLFVLAGCATGKVILAAGPEFLERDGLTDTVALWEDGLRTDPDGDFFEWWYFDASFSDGSTAVIVFFTKGIINPSGPVNPRVSITITRPDGKIITAEVVSDEFHASKDECDVRIGNSSVKGDLRNYRLRFESEDISADLRFESLVPPWRPGAGKTYYSKDFDDYFAWLPAVPYARVDGALRYEGKNRRVSGTGYHDHNWGNVKLNRVMTQWYWGRARIGEYTVIFSRMLTSPAYGERRIPVFFLARGEEVLFGDKFEMTIETSKWVMHEGGREYPEDLVIKVKEGRKTAQIVLSQPVLVQAGSLIESLPRFTRFIAGLFSRPYYFRFRSRFMLLLDIEGVHIEKQGTGLFEMMLLRGRQTVR
jgi:predicted secreted hydrolase